MENENKTAQAASGRERFEQIKTAVVSLTSKQKRDLIALLGVPQATSKKAQDEATASVLYDEAVWVLSTATGGTFAPYSITKASIGKEVAAATATFLEFTDKHSARALTTRDRAKLYRHLVGIVLEHMHRASIPVTLKTTFQQCSNVALIVDQALPGYAQANLLHVAFEHVLRR